MLPSTKALASDLKFAVVDSLRHHDRQASGTVTVLDLIDDKEAPGANTPQRVG